MNADNGIRFADGTPLRTNEGVACLGAAITRNVSVKQAISNRIKGTNHLWRTLVPSGKTTE